MKTSVSIEKVEKGALAWAVLAAAASVGGALLIAGPIQSAGGAAPVPEAAASPALLTQGHGFFDQTCADCHGDDAHGDEGPDLHNLAISNARIVATIKNGVKGEMPSFRKKYDDGQIAALVSYLRTLR